MSNVKNDDSSSTNVDRANLICNRIDILRPKLLDLTRRNPLISTKFSDRSNSLVRIVDEVPDLLLRSIVSQSVRIVPLPDLSTDPEDEYSLEFQSSLAEARLNDEVYLSILDEIEQVSDDAPNLFAQAERLLKDRLRGLLNMPSRQTKSNLSLQQHAINHGISPHYELPDNEQLLDYRRNHDFQTLLLPDTLERRLNMLFAKEKSWKEETGISVLHAALGFIEWEDGNNSSTQLSPLILIPVQIEKKRTGDGQEFWVVGDEAEVYENKILAEKLRLEFNIILPKYDGQGVEQYFAEVAEQSPRNMTWRIRRWAAIGVFPSARLAMYHDLDPSGWDFASHQVVSTLFGGSDTGHDAAPFGDEYDVDDPEIEKKVPYLIADADSSQFSTIVDVANGKNLAVEGPPGTGKSQTIVNTIAASLALGMKVLFVAEKSAALEVVRARLEAYGIGNFILPLQANRSGKEQVIASIRERMEMKVCANPSELDYSIAQFKSVRNDLKLYVDILSSTFGHTNLSIHSIIWRYIKFTNFIENLPDKIKKIHIPVAKTITSDKLQGILLRCKQVEEAWSTILECSDLWKEIQVPNIDPFRATDLLKLADETSKHFANVDSNRRVLTEFNFSPTTKKNNLANILVATKSAINMLDKDFDIAGRLTSLEIIDKIQNYLNDVELWRKKYVNISGHFSVDIDLVIIDNLFKIKELFLKYDLVSLNKENLDALIYNYRISLKKNQNAQEICNQVIGVSAVFGCLTVSDFIRMQSLLPSISKQILAVRNTDLDDPLLQTFLTKQMTRAQSLRESRIVLGEEFILSSLPEREYLVNYATALTSSGIFSVFSSKYREAKKFYQLITKSKQFEKYHAANKLRELSEWQAELKKFSENETLQRIIGVHFDGIDTDFIPFQETVLFFNSVDHLFPGSNYSELRTFLKYGDGEKIQSLPIVEEVHPIHEIEDQLLTTLVDQVIDLENQLDMCQSDITQLKELITVFSFPEQISKNEIVEYPIKVEALLKQRELLINNCEIKNVLGVVYNGEIIDKSVLENGLVLGAHLIKLDECDREAFLATAKQGRLKYLDPTISQIIECDTQAHSSLEDLAQATNTMPENWLANKSNIELSKWLELASKDKDGLVAYSRLVASKSNMECDGYMPLIEAIFSVKQQDNLCEIIDALITREMAREIYSVYGETLTSYNGSKLNVLRKQLREVDRKVIELSRQRLQSELFYKACPPHGIGAGRKSEFTELALLKNEISKKQRHIPIRSLTRKASKALLELKPCWMMSPLAVAQYLPRGATEFDLVIIDEASQMTPEDSVGALIRAKQAMVVGDTNQLPPTSFFRKMLEDESADDDEKVTEESILEMANASFKPARRLRWHYRSRHSGLISFSNKHVYNGHLVVFPSAQEDHPDMGVSYVKVNGICMSGANPEEAKIMVEAIVEFMRVHKNKSLGVVLLNQKQRDLLIDEMNFALEQHPHAKDYVEKWEVENDGLESFFIKNLENVQGDERDVIFIGTVYGPEKEGMPVMQRFGPINGITGKRRLNVLFSRAKERITTFSSMTAIDIRAEEGSNPGVHMLKCWLEYSASGILEAGQYVEKDPDSDFEEHVIGQIKSIGCEAIPQVGVKGYSIDIGVKHPSWPHGFIMGVECDGATYHSSRSARDRDRLRQEVLEGLGWNLYRIWSTDWFEDPRRETEKLRSAIQARLADLMSQ
jgi:hypothetical protein